MGIKMEDGYTSDKDGMAMTGMSMDMGLNIFLGEWGRRCEL